MEIKKIHIEKSKFELNLKFYYFLKNLVKIKLSSNQVELILRIYYINSTKNYEQILQKIIEDFILNLNNDTKKDKLLQFFNEIENKWDLKLMIFSLKLYLIKDLLLQEAKIKNLLDITKLENLNPLSLEYDKITTYSPYSTRVNGALLSLIFFDKLEREELNFLSNDSVSFLKILSKLGNELTKKGIEPNQIFMLMFSESVNQSIISDSGSNYEERILSVLLDLGISESSITKQHDKNDSSTEFDFFFELENRTYGIGAKRTLRERYKQFIKTAIMTKIDIMIEITLGLDLNEEKAKTIRKHNVYIFVSDEIYNSKYFLKELEGIHPVSQLTLETLKSLK
ncbi:MAG: hypothetical protein LAT82_02750 [Nanoarchaeota archaeon]|nr:hypothetical protein [Nanoarchaeota archaeon]